MDCRNTVDGSLFLCGKPGKGGGAMRHRDDAWMDHGTVCEAVDTRYEKEEYASCIRIENR